MIFYVFICKRFYVGGEDFKLHINAVNGLVQIYF